MLDFHKISLKDKKEFSAYYQACPQKSSDYSFINLWSWQEKYHTELAYADNLCWIRQRCGDNVFYAAPIGDWKRTEWQKIIYRRLGTEFALKKLPETLALKLEMDFPGMLILKNDRDNWEYLYDASMLIALEGQDFSTQRKLSNQFKQYYNYAFRFIDQKDVPALTLFQEEWMAAHAEDAEKNSLDFENKAIYRALRNWNKLKPEVFGAAIWIEGKIAAYTIAEKLDKDTIAVHFEKALDKYKGAYQAVNRIFLENLSGIRTVNREHDLGLPGLRRAKLRYRPRGFVRKYDLSGYFTAKAKEEDNHGISENCRSFDCGCLSGRQHL